MFKLKIRLNTHKILLSYTILINVYLDKNTTCKTALEYKEIQNMKSISIKMPLLPTIILALLISCTQAHAYEVDADGIPEASAFHEVKMAAERGDPIAQTDLGLMYQAGRGVKPNINEALKWWRLAAEKNDSAAQYNIGYAYSIGAGVPQDYQEALKWYKLAANQGYAWAETNIGYLYYNGLGMDINVAEAINWYKKGEKDGDSVAKEFLDKIGNTEEGYLANTTTKANAGDQFAQNELGRMYLTGDIVKQDYKKSYNWFKKSAEQGNATAQYYIGYMYLKGLGIAQDYKQALYWTKLAAEQDDAGAQNNLAGMYLNGLGVKADRAEAMRWYEKAAAKGNESAIKSLQALKSKR